MDWLCVGAGGLMKSSPCVCPLQPVVVILCPGWEKAQRVFELLEDIPAAAALRPTIVLVGEMDQAKSVKIQRNCELYML